MGVHRLPQLEDYWSSHPLLGAKGIVAGMSYRRFRVLLSCLHLVDNSTAVRRGDTGFDKLHKIRPLLDIIQQNIKSSYNPHREVSIDEAMVGFKGRSSLKQYMPMKSIKRGFKIWCLCDSTNGYTYTIIIYTGASSATENGGLGPTVVIQLADPLLDKAYFLYYDNYFSSIDLATTLLSRNTYTIATTRCNRKKWPDALKDVKEMNKALQRGQHRSVVTEQVECVAWKDSKVVTMINTISNPSSLTHVRRKGKDGQLKPSTYPVKLYNKHMGGVDLADARRKTYSCSRRSKKWWHRLFYYLIDLSVVNAYILFSESNHCARRSQKDFVLELSEQLMAKFNARKRPAHPSGQSLPSAHFSNKHFPNKHFPE